MKVLATVKYKLRTYKSEYKELGLKWMLNSVKSDIVYPFKRFYRFVVKMFKYGKLLWFDFEFDWTYLLKILQFKMRLMADNFDKNGITVSAPEKAKELRLCVALIDRILKDEYADMQLEKLKEEYGEVKWDCRETDNPKLHSLHIYRERAPEGTPEYEDERKRFRKIMDDAEAQKNRDIEYLFDTMKKRIQGWWD